MGASRRGLLGFWCAVLITMGAACASDEAAPTVTEPVEAAAADDAAADSTDDIGSGADDSATAEADEAEPANDADAATGTAAETATATTTAADTDGDVLTSLEPSGCEFQMLVPLPRTPECFILTVPTDWDDPDPQDTVVIPIARFAATEPADDDPIVYLEGGPGGHSLDGLQFQYPLLVEPLNATRDFIAFDQRGAGLSEPSLACPEVVEATLVAMESADAIETEEAEGLVAVEACRDRLLDDGVDLTEYHSINSAYDLDALRSHLGYDQLNVLGISYGTRLAQTYARLFPDSIRSMILDSVDPVEGALFSAMSTNGQRAFRQLFESCETDPACDAAYPDLEARFFALAERLDAEPQALEPLHPLTGESRTMLVTGADLISQTFAALYNQSFFAVIPQLVVDAENDDFGVLEALSSQALVQGDFLSTGMYLSVLCHEDIPFDDRAQLDVYEPATEDYGQLSQIVSGGSLFDACEQWPAGTADAVEDELVVTDVPTLLLGGEYDPITPPSGFDEITPGLSTYWEYVLPHLGHGITPTPCGAEIVNSFLAGPEMEPDSSCIADSEPPAFTRRDIGEFDLVAFETSLLGSTIRSVRPADWTPQGAGAFVRGSTLVDPALLIVQGTGGAAPGLLRGFLEQSFSGSLGEEVTLADGERITVEDTTWEVFDAELEDQRLRVAANTEALVVLGGYPDEFDDLVDRLLLPVLGAVEVE